MFSVFFVLIILSKDYADATSLTRIAFVGHNGNRADRANTDAIAAAGAERRIQMRLRGSTDPQPEADRALIADLAAGTTNDPLFGEATGRDGRLQGPRRIERRIAVERPAPASRQAVAAKGAAAERERDLRKTAVPDPDDRLRTSPHAIIAALAPF